MVKEVIGIIGGTGLGDVLRDHISQPEIQDIKTPFGRPSSPITTGWFGEREIAFINRHGDGHPYNPSQVPYAANIFALKKLGVRTLIGSGAVGSLREEMAPKDLVLVDQFIDKTYRRKSSFFEEAGTVHCEFSHPVCGRLSKKIGDKAEKVGIQVHKGGTYVCMEGPQFSTRAESLMHRKWGGDLIGMTAIPEAKLAREAQMCYSLVAMVSDYDCWKESNGESKNKMTLLKEIIRNLQEATSNAVELIRRVAEEDSESLSDDDCECRKSLELAVWTNEKQINKTKMDELEVLFK